MSVLAFTARQRCRRYGLKGPHAEQWLRQRGVDPPAAANSWTSAARGNGDGALLVARLGTGEFFVEDADDLGDSTPLPPLPQGVYPVLREDAAFALTGDGALDVLRQVCNVDFSALAAASNPVVMTLMVGVSVLVVPLGGGAVADYLIWCDPTFGAYLESVLGKIVLECGGSYTGEVR